MDASTKRLVESLEALEQSPLRDEIIANAKRSLYHDFKSDHPAPLHLLVVHLGRLQTDEASKLAALAMNGAFDADHDEAEAWAQSPEGRRALADFGSFLQ